ncbi:hypothetical protein A3Q56_06781, partial [Intoshia linei]
MISQDSNKSAATNQYRALFILKSENKFRKLIHIIVNYKYFDVFITIVICLSSIALAAEDPVHSDSLRNDILDYIDYAFTIIFTIEMILKIIDRGLVLHPKSYLRDIWNILDAIVVICAIIALSFTDKNSAGKNLNTIKSLRVFRVLRPLKTINRVPKLKAVFDCVINSLKNVTVIMIVYLLFLLIFSVIAVQLLKGKFFYCTDSAKLVEADCRGNYIIFDYETGASFKKSRIWLRRNFHYDDVPNALLTLFTVQTGEGWPSILQHSLDATYIDKGPIKGFHMEIALFYIVYFIVFPFFFVNIFVALIIITFQEEGENILEEHSITKNQKQCIDYAIYAKPIMKQSPKVKEGFHYKIYSLVVSRGFEYFIMVLISLNTLTLTMKNFHFPYEFVGMNEPE